VNPKVITLCNSSYFGFGRPFLHTRSKIKADFIVYGPDLTKDQISQLAAHNMEYKKVDGTRFDTQMQFLKFELLFNEHCGAPLTFVDFDTFFLRDWHDDVFSDNFDLGVTVRNEFVKKGGPLRALANGGVIFCGPNKSAADFCEYAMKVMKAGGHKSLPEYDEFFTRALEKGRPPHKTWKRENLRWWCDQVFLSCLVHRFKPCRDKKPIKCKQFYAFSKSHNIGLFNCELYNCLDPVPAVLKGLYKRGSFIIHLKNRGRDTVNQFMSGLKELS